MERITSTLVKDSVQFLCLRGQYKSDLLDCSRLTKAADLAANQHLLLESEAPETWKEPRLKAVGRQLGQWIKRVRQPGGIWSVEGDEVEVEEEDDMTNLARGPMYNLLTQLVKTQKIIKRQATPATPASKNAQTVFEQ